MKLIRFDWAVKKILRHKANFGILEGFLTELLKFDLTIETILESEGNKDDEYDKFNRVDILVRTTSGELVLVELQNTAEQDYFQRMLYGVSKLVTEYIKEGEVYGEIKKVYSINIIYFQLGQGDDYIYKYVGEFVGENLGDTLQASKNQKEKFGVEKVSDIFPKYYILKVNNFDDVAKNTLDEWIYFLKNSEVKKEFKAKGLELVEEKLKYEQLNEIDKKIYQRFQENRRIEKSVMQTAIEEGRKEGIEEGRKEGIEQGIEQGREEGREQGVLQAKEEIVKNAISKGLDNQTISSITDFSEEQIEEIRQKIK